MMIHFSGRERLDHPGVLVFPKISICLDCGFTRFATPETELQVLKNAVASVRAAASSPLAVGALRQ
jgi:hypothetical protein